MAASRHPGRATIVTRQAAQLDLLLRTLVKSNPFYRARIETSGVLQSRDLRSTFCRSFPFTTKSELIANQRDNPPYGTNLTFPISDYRRYHQTSGTSGAPMRWLDDRESWKAMVAQWTQIFEASGTNSHDRVMFAFSFGPFLGFWLAFQAAEEIGALCIPGGGLSSASRVRMLTDNQATVLCCTPTYALRLAEAAAAENVDLTTSSLRLLLVAGEPGGSVPAIRERLQNAWPTVKIFDHHGMTETGPVSFQCPASPGRLHIMEEGYLAEILEPGSDKPVPAGQRGELILTTLQRVGSPLLRYRTGDFVQAAAEGTCACGRNSLVLDGGILGRVDDMLVIRGVNVYPSAVDQVIAQHDDILEYQARVTKTDAMLGLQISIETGPEIAHPDSVARRLEKSLQTAFNLRIDVKVVPPQTLPRFEMKAKRWVK